MAKQDLTIGCLSLSAIILLAAVFVVGALQTQPLQASGMSVSDGNYTMLTGRLTAGTELVYLIDNKTDQLAVYRITESTQKLARTELIPLDDRQSDKPGQKRMKP